MAVSCHHAMHTDDAAKRQKDREFEREALPWLPHVARYALSLTRNDQDADDLVQETYLRAYRSWTQYTIGTECRAWLFRICRNLFLRTRQSDARQVHYDDPDLEALAAAAVHAAAQEGGYNELFTRVDLADAVERALADLPDAFRDAVILVDVEDQSYDTAAQVLGVPIGTVRSRLFRGRRLLQESLLAFARDAGLAAAGDTPSESELRP
jgi:RNA polymerase sigma-70 factor (ECF subfamily)